jgi:hypothetical protein
MKIRTSEDLYVGRYYFDKKNGKHYSHFNAIIPYGMTEPFKIPKHTEVVDCDDNEFESYKEFLETLEEGMFKFVFEDEEQEKVFDNLIACANIVNYGEDSFEFCTCYTISLR